MPDTIQEQAGEALGRAGQRLAAAETGVRDAIAGLNQAIDAAHAAGIGPRYARAMVGSGTHLGMLGRAYFNREIRSWDDIYESGPRPVNQNDSELLDLHARPRPQAPAFSFGWASSVPGTLARAGQELARAETGFDTAYARFSDASDFAQYAQIPAGQATSLVTALSGPLGKISSELVTAEVEDWDASITLDLASMLADGTEPPGFWAAAADARATKGAGDYGAAAASWTLARDQLPSGHLMGDGLDSLISALGTASGTGQHVARAGYIVHHSTEPPSPWNTGQLAAAVRTHAAALGDAKQALRNVLDGWTDGAIAAAFDAARDPDEAVARACLFATFERADQLRTAPPQDVSFAQPPVSAPAAAPATGPAMAARPDQMPSGSAADPPLEPPKWEHAVTFTGGSYFATIGGHRLFVDHGRDRVDGYRASVDGQYAGQEKDLAAAQKMAEDRARRLPPKPKIPRIASDDDVPNPQEMTAAYRAAHGEDVPWLTRQQWQAGQMSTATGTVRTAPWYLAAVAAKKDGRPMSAVPRYMAAARMDATAGRLRDHRDPLESGHDARDVADALSDAAAATRAGDLTEAREAIRWARSNITPGSSLHRVLDEHETPVINLAGPARRSGPAASPPRVARRPSPQGQRQARRR